MPFSLLISGYPRSDLPIGQAQGPALQGMFFNLLEAVEPAVVQRLHGDQKYRPYTLSPLGIGDPDRDFRGFRLPKRHLIQKDTPCYLRVTFLEDGLFPTFSRYFLQRAEPTFLLGNAHFIVTNVLATSDQNNPWSGYCSYAELIERASRMSHKIALRFVTPTSFRRGDMDFPLPDPRLVFRNYRKRFTEFFPMDFLSDFDTLVEYHTGIAYLNHVRTELIKTKRVSLVGFTGNVTYEIDRKAPPDLVFQMNLLADYAFFCGTGRKTTVGMGQTVRDEGQRAKGEGRKAWGERHGAKGMRQRAKGMR